MPEPPPRFALKAGEAGAAGAQGPAGTISVGTVTSVSYGTVPAAYVTNVGTPSAAVLNFGVPQGAPGSGGGSSSGAGSGTPSLYATLGSDLAVADNVTHWTNIGQAINFYVVNPLTTGRGNYGGQASAANKHRGTYWEGLYADCVVDSYDRPIYALGGGTVYSYQVLHDEFCMLQPAYYPLGGPCFARYGSGWYNFNCWKSGWYLVEVNVVFDNAYTTGWREVQICESTYTSGGTWTGPTVRASLRVPAVSGANTALCCSATFAVDGHYKVAAPSGGVGAVRERWGAGQISVHVRQTNSLAGTVNVLADSATGGKTRLAVTYLRSQYDAWYDSNTPVEP
jgi:hypothetical protein